MSSGRLDVADGVPGRSAQLHVTDDPSGLRGKPVTRWQGSLLLCCLAMCSTEAATPPAASEYQVKAAFLFQFSRFVEWPREAFANSDAPLLICVLGTNPFGPALAEMAEGELAYTHPLQVQSHDRVEDLDACHIVFVSSDKENVSRRVVQYLSGKSVLTVSDSSDFARHGGVIGLVTVNGKVRVQVNRNSADAAQLKISAKLLRVADLTG